METIEAAVDAEGLIRGALDYLARRIRLRRVILSDPMPAARRIRGVMSTWPWYRRISRG